MQNDRPRKLQRISQACDLCHRRSIRCRPSNEDGERCQNCYDFDVACTYDRPSKRKKHPQAPAVPQQSIATSSSASSSSRVAQPGAAATYDNFEPPGYSDQPSARNDSIGKSIGKANEFGVVDIIDPDEGSGIELSWKAFAISCELYIFELFDVYMEVVYPLYPFFHEASEKQRLRNRGHLRDKGFFSSIMAMCAVASARIRDGAQPKKMPEMSSDPRVSSEVFFAAAKSVFDSELDRLVGIDYVRACSLLALASIQYNRPQQVQEHLGIGATLTAMQRFYNEKNWARNLSDTRRETFRRVYWGTYSLEVYSTLVWNCFLRFQELHINIRYPSMHDEATPHNALGPDIWLAGWNFAIDIYRVLEHVLNKQRASRFQHDDRRSVDSLVFKDTFSENHVMTTMLNMYYGLPNEFKTTPPMTGDPKQDIYGFQAANIQATLQLLRMMLFSLEDGPGVDRKCDVASEVLTVFKTIPSRYLRAISTPLVYQLAKIGSILGSVLEEPLSEQLYLRVRLLLTDMAEMLDKFEEHLHSSAGVAHKLLKQIEKIDQFMETRRSTIQHAAAPQQMLAQPPQNVVNNHMPMPMQGVGTMPDVQLPSELALEWPWPLYQEGPYFSGNF